MKARRIIALMMLMFCLTAAYRVGYDDESIYQSLDTLAEIMTLARDNATTELESEELVEGAIDGLLNQLDPHTSFYNRDRYKTMKEDQHGAFFGIGIIVGIQNEKLTVISPLAGAPAAMAGIRAGDVIAQIDDVDSEEKATHEAIRLLRGERGTHVKLKILRSGITEPLYFTLTRAEIPSLNVRTSFKADDKTGYVALKEFGETATAEVEEAITKLQKEGIEQVIIDLRGNPGGLLPQAISLSRLFLGKERLVVSTKGRLKNSNQKYYTDSDKTFNDLALIVLIDRGSASASEIVSGAIQDHDRGLVLGTSSWGKGLVQSVFPLSDGDTGLALTTSRYYTPSGRNIQGNYDSLEEYYTPKSAKDMFFSASEEDASTFKTLHGRQVLEVRGITPDVFISYPKTPKLSITLESQHNAFFNFATHMQDKLPAITRDFEVNDELMTQFKSWLQEKEIPADDFETHREYLRQKLTFQFLYTSPSDESEAWAWAYRMSKDHHVKAALELFPKARELLQVYKGESEIRPDYMAELRAYSRIHDEAASQSAAIDIKENP